ncbi:MULTISPECIES: DUF5994 family protein [Streptomyces]|jgi:hypothetical protein|uniref:Uncharacterized protein n=1 Tax=Streptomyces odorifer TaxID=53450 RepID=A0A7Y6KKE2_9ACTN|nr:MULTISPECIES: DUF5994 family protein [Streptomyces]NUV36023.1 hypothetical protein [Streptomyces sp. KAI-27]NUV48846.1 hypothetical protein [Streptomyces sp. CAI-78]MBL0781272.1 hypothetical protein [Streptomyces albidoflavus]MBL0804318.1 hypothetical protein [Streptomyces albidoflavus]MBV1957365.1 hypothetical protein [Streptomyces sp. BV333]
MADVDPDTGARRRDTGAHPAAEAGRFGPGPVLRLEITGHRDGLFDGAWWPYSHRVNVEIPRLIGGLAGHWDPVTRVGVDLETWGVLPTRLVIDDRVVRIDGYPVADDTALVTRDDRALFSLLVVPPEAAPEAAVAAMARALDPGNTAAAGTILTETGVRPGHPRR